MNKTINIDLIKKKNIGFIFLSISVEIILFDKCVSLYKKNPFGLV